MTTMTYTHCAVCRLPFNGFTAAGKPDPKRTAVNVGDDRPFICWGCYSAPATQGRLWTPPPGQRTLPDPQPAGRRRKR